MGAAKSGGEHPGVGRGAPKTLPLPLKSEFFHPKKSQLPPLGGQRVPPPRPHCPPPGEGSGVSMAALTPGSTEQSGDSARTARPFCAARLRGGLRGGPAPRFGAVRRLFGAVGRPFGPPRPLGGSSARGARPGSARGGARRSCPKKTPFWWQKDSGAGGQPRKRGEKHGNRAKKKKKGTYGGIRRRGWGRTRRDGLGGLWGASAAGRNGRKKEDLGFF